MKTSKLLFERAKLFIPGGVNSPVRAFKSVGGHPIFFQSAKGSIIKDVDDKEYIVESCNQDTAWISSPDSISCWIGSSDGDWFSAPDGEDKPIEFIEEWINKWKKNWTSTEN